MLVGKNYTQTNDGKGKIANDIFIKMITRYLKGLVWRPGFEVRRVFNYIVCNAVFEANFIWEHFVVFNLIRIKLHKNNPAVKFK